MDSMFLSVKEVALMTDLSTRTIYRRIDDGTISAFHTSGCTKGKILIPRADLRALMQRKLDEEAAVKNGTAPRPWSAAPRKLPVVPKSGRP